MAPAATVAVTVIGSDDMFAFAHEEWLADLTPEREAVYRSFSCTDCGLLSIDCMCGGDQTFDGAFRCNACQAEIDCVFVAENWELGLVRHLRWHNQPEDVVVDLSDTVLGL
jgi:hypothetical protein